MTKRLKILLSTAGYKNTLSSLFFPLGLYANNLYKIIKLFLLAFIACNLNVPGSWHDSYVAHPIYKKLCLQTPEGYYLMTNTAFPCGSDKIAGRIKAPMKDGVHLPVDHAKRENFMQHDRQLLSF